MESGWESLVFFKVKIVVKKRILRSYVEIKFEIVSFTKHFEAQYLESSRLLK